MINETEATELRRREVKALEAIAANLEKLAMEARLSKTELQKIVTELKSATRR